MTAIFGFLLGIVATFGAPAIVIVLVVAARRAKERNDPPAFARAASIVAAVLAILYAAGLVVGVVAMRSATAGATATDKARALGEGISEIMNTSGFVTLLAVIAAVVLFGWQRRASRTR